MFILVLAAGILCLFLYFGAVKIIVSRIRWNFDFGELVDFDAELKGRYIDHLTKMAILAMFSQGMIVIHGFSGDITEAVKRVFYQDNFSFKRVRKPRPQR